MGYRSEVRIITSKKGYQMLNKFVNQYLNDYPEDKENNLFKHFDIKKNMKNQCYFGWNDIKWYENTFPEVDAIMNGLNYLRDNNYSYRYSRIGENYEDIEESYHNAEKTEEKLDYPYIIREFNDDYFSSNELEQEELEN